MTCFRASKPFAVRYYFQVICPGKRVSLWKGVITGNSHDDAVILVVFCKQYLIFCTMARYFVSRVRLFRCCS